MFGYQSAAPPDINVCLTVPSRSRHAASSPAIRSTRLVLPPIAAKAEIPAGRFAAQMAQDTRAQPGATPKPYHNLEPSRDVASPRWAIAPLVLPSATVNASTAMRSISHYNSITLAHLGVTAVTAEVAGVGRTGQRGE